MTANTEAKLASALALSNTLAAATGVDGSGIQDVDVHSVARMIGELIAEAIDGAGTNHEK